MKTRVQLYSTFPVSRGWTLADRINQVSAFTDRAVPPVASSTMLPYGGIQCVNESDPITLEPLTLGSYVSVYHTEDARNGLEHPSCLEITSVLDMLRTRDRGQVHVELPIRAELNYYVNRDKTIAILTDTHSHVGLRPVFDHICPITKYQIWRFVHFIPPNYPLDAQGTEVYPYDSIVVHTGTNKIQGQRRTLAAYIYRQYAQSTDHSTPIHVPELADASIRVSEDVSEVNVLDVISQPHRTIFTLDEILI